MAHPFNHLLKYFILDSFLQSPDWSFFYLVDIQFVLLKEKKHT